MPTLQFDSVESPFDTDASAARDAAYLVATGQMVGILPSELDHHQLGRDVIQIVLSGLAERGVARDAALSALSAQSGEDYRKLLSAAGRQLRESPMPAGTWPVLIDVIGEELLADLLGIAVVSVRRYAGAQRHTPGDVADRLHYLALLVADLSGGYNDYGVRRWFVRRRKLLDGATPAEVLAGKFDPDGEAASRVQALVEGLSGAGAT